jgi:hypothetical protein
MPLQRNRIPLAVRFKRHISERLPNGCILWIGTVNSRGYGSINNGYGKMLYAHRVAWELANGPIPAGLFACHRCDVRRCVNPEHLFLGTVSDNQADMVAKGRSNRGERHGNVRVTEPIVREIRAKYAAGGITMVELAIEYGVCRTNILHIVNRKSWKHVT